MMIRALFKALGSLALAAAGLAFLTAVSLLVLGSFIATWPILRLSPRERRLRASVELAAAGLTLLSTFAAGRDGSE